MDRITSKIKNKIKIFLPILCALLPISNFNVLAKRLTPNASECEKKCHGDCFMEKLEDKDKCVYKEHKCLEKCEAEATESEDSESEKEEKIDSNSESEKK